MGQELHARKRRSGWKFRIWTTTSDYYLTRPLTEEELLVTDFTDGLTSKSKEIARAKKTGSSSPGISNANIDGPWRKAVQ